MRFHHDDLARGQFDLLHPTLDATSDYKTNAFSVRILRHAKIRELVKARPYSDAMSANLKQMALIVLGWILVLLGITGVVLPILPGVPLLIAGLLILGRFYAWPRRCLALLRTKAQSLGPRWTGHWRTAYRWLFRTCAARRKAQP